MRSDTVLAQEAFCTGPLLLHSFVCVTCYTLIRGWQSSLCSDRPHPASPLFVDVLIVLRGLRLTKVSFLPSCQLSQMHVTLCSSLRDVITILSAVLLFNRLLDFQFKLFYRSDHFWLAMSPCSDRCSCFAKWDRVYGLYGVIS